MVPHVLQPFVNKMLSPKYNTIYHLIPINSRILQLLIGNFSIKSSYSSQYTIKKAYKMFQQNNLIGFSSLNLQFSCQNCLSINTKNVSYRKAAISHHISGISARIFSHQIVLNCQIVNSSSPKRSNLTDAPMPRCRQRPQPASLLRHLSLTNHFPDSQHLAR